MLQTQGLEPIPTSTAGGMTGNIHWTQGLAKMLQAYQGGKGQRKASEERTALTGRMQEERSQRLAEALRCLHIRKSSRRARLWRRLWRAGARVWFLVAFPPVVLLAGLLWRHRSRLNLMRLRLMYRLAACQTIKGWPTRCGHGQCALWLSIRPSAIIYWTARTGWKKWAWKRT